MAVLRCNNCGAKVKLIQGETSAVCEYCGSEMSAFESTEEFEIDSKGTLVQYNGKGGDVIIPDGVKAIGRECFRKNNNIFSVKLPESIEKLQFRAFSGAVELEEINFPESLIEIGAYAFISTSIKKAIIPSGVSRIEEYAFSSCKKLRDVQLSKSTRRIGKGAFYGCQKLSTITFPNRLKEIGYEAFSQSGITEVIIPDSTEIIGSMAFSDCNSLTHVEIGDGVEIIEKWAFSNCKDLKDVVLGNGVVEIRDYAFTGCISLKSVIMGNGVKDIQENVFKKCTSLERVVLSNKLKFLGKNAFYQAAIKKIEFPKSLEAIGDYCFYECAFLEKIEIPESVSRIGKSAFSGCLSLTTAIFPGIEKVENGIFSCCTSLKRIVIGEGCKVLADPFGFHDALEIELPSTIETIYSLPSDSIVRSPKNSVIEKYCEEHDSIQWICTDNSRGSGIGS